MPAPILNEQIMVIVSVMKKLKNRVGIIFVSKIELQDLIDVQNS